MLKITTEAKAGMTNIILEGKLAGPWVEELARSWQTAAAESVAAVRIDLCAVTFIDQEGKTLLTEMHRKGVEMVSTGCLNRSIVEGIIRSEEKPRKK